MFSRKHIKLMQGAFYASRPNWLMLKEDNNFNIALTAWRAAVQQMADMLINDGAIDSDHAEQFKHDCNW